MKVLFFIIVHCNLTVPYSFVVFYFYFIFDTLLFYYVNLFIFIFYSVWLLGFTPTQYTAIDTRQTKEMDDSTYNTTEWRQRAIEVNRNKLLVELLESYGAKF